MIDLADPRVSFQMRPEVQAAYERFMRRHDGELDVPLLCESMWLAGGQSAIKAMAEFGDLLPRLGALERRIEGVCATVKALADLLEGDCG